MAAEQKKQNIDLLEEDDEFEEFPTEGKSVHFVGFLLMFWMMKINEIVFVKKWVVRNDELCVIKAKSNKFNLKYIQAWLSQLTIQGACCFKKSLCVWLTGNSAWGDDRI